MAKRIKIQVFPDGRIQADIQGIKGKKCTDYIRVLEEILEAEAVDSAYTPEYYEPEKVILDEVEQERLSNEERA